MFPFAYEIIATNGLNMRATASTTGAKVMLLPRGAIVEATSDTITVTTGYEWLLVTYHDTEHNTDVSGYIAIKRLTTGEMYVKKVRG